MPVGLGSDTAALLAPHSHSPIGEVNGEDQDVATDVEDLYSEGDQSPIPKRKTFLAAPHKDEGALTDTEDMDLSGEEDDIIQEKKNLPTVQELGIVPDPVKEVINLTEGFAREASPLLASESDREEEKAEDVKCRHKKSLKKVEQQSQLALAVDDVDEGLTDVEDMEASGDEEEEAEVEDSLPEHYLDQSEDVSNKSKMKPAPKTQKVCLVKEDESSDDEGTSRRVSHSKYKDGLNVEAQDEKGNTDVEDLVFSDKAEDKSDVQVEKTEAKDKLRRKKVIRRKVVPKKPAPSKTLGAPAPGEAGGLTDVEVLTGDEDQSGLQDDIYGLTVPDEDQGPLTDSEDIEASDVEDADDLVAKPLDKAEPATLPDPQREKISISEVEEPAIGESGDETDEEGAKSKVRMPMNPRRTVVHEPILPDSQDALEPEEPIEYALTDTEDIDMDEREENEMIEEIISRIPEEREIYTIRELDESLGRVSKKEMMRFTDSELMEKIKEAEAAGLTIQQALAEEATTDVEDLEEVGNSKPKASKVVKGKKKKEAGGIDDESLSDSDGGEVVQHPQKKGGRRGRRKLPLTPQLSEVRSVQTKQGPLSIIITEEDADVSGEVLDAQEDSVIIETDDRDEDKTDVEIISEEEVELLPSEINRPMSPLPPHLKYNVLQSPKRELVHIKEDKHGVPQVTIRKLRKDEIFVSDMEDTAVTDTEDIDVSEEEALRLVGATEDSTSDFELPDIGPTIVSSKVEEIALSKKAKRKAVDQSKLALVPQDEDSHTDVELLSDQDEATLLTVRVPTPGAHTDIEDFETSENEEAEVSREDGPTPDIIRDAAIMKTIVFKEGIHGTTYTEDAQVAPEKTSFLGVEAEVEGTTDVEDLEASGAEDDDPPEYPAVELPEQESSSVDICEKTSALAGSNEARQVKDNLLLPEDNLNTTTDVESLGDGEGNRCAANSGVSSSRPLTVDSSSQLPCPSSSPTHPKLCIHPGLSLESDPFCGELTQPLVVEAQLEQVYYHAPQGEPEGTEVELEAHNGCVVRRRQVVASLCQAREVRRFWSCDSNSPLQQTEMGDLASPAPHRKGFKTILYLEQPNLLDTISISDTLCDPNCFTDDRLLDFDSSSVDSYDDRFTYRDSDIVTIIDRFNLEAGSSIDDLPSPRLSSIGSSVYDSLYSGHSLSMEMEPHAVESIGDSPELMAGADADVLRERLEEVKDGRADEGIELTGGLLEREVGVAWGDSVGSPVSISWCSSSDSGTPVQSVSPYSTDLNLTEALTSDRELSDDILFETEGGTLTRGGSMRGNCFPYYSDVEESPSPSQDCGCPPTSLLASHSSSSNEQDFGTTASAKTVLESCLGGEGNYPNCSPSCSESVSVSDNLKCDVSGTDRLEYCSVSEWDGCDTEQESSVACIDLPVTESVSELSSIEGNTETVFMTGKYIESTVDCNSEQSSSQCDDFEVSEDEKGMPDISTKFLNEQDLGRFTHSVSEVHDDDNREIIEQPLQKIKSSITLVKAIESGIHCEKERSLDTEIPFLDSSTEPASHTAPSGLIMEDNKQICESYESDGVNLADSVLGLEEKDGLIRSHQYPYHDDFSPTLVDGSVQLTSSGLPTCITDQGSRESVERIPTNENEGEGSQNTSVPLYWRHTLPRALKQTKHKVKLTTTKAGSSDRHNQETVTNFVGVKGLIDQWEEIVEEEKRRSLPASPAIGRRILPPFEERKQSLGSTYEVDCYKSGEKDVRNLKLEASEECPNSRMLGENVVEEVASVGDIIQQFEGWVGMGEKQSTTWQTWQRLYRRAPSPSPRSPSQPRRVATVKPLREPQPQKEETGAVEEEQLAEQLHTDQQQGEESFVIPMENSTIAEFMPRVMESLTIPKTSSWRLQGLVSTSAGVLYPEGTHEVSQPPEQQQQPPAHPPHDQGLGEEELSSVMEIDGSDPFTTSTSTTHITRIVRRTKVGEDGKVKEEEEVYEEY